MMDDRSFIISYLAAFAVAYLAENCNNDAGLARNLSYIGRGTPISSGGIATLGTIRKNNGVISIG